MDNTDISTFPSVVQASWLSKYGYTLEKVLNNQNRWHTKIVRSLIGPEDAPFVSTTYVNSQDYLKLLESTTLLRCKDKLTPSIVNLYPEDNTIVCNYMGEFFQDYLLRSIENVSVSTQAVFEYLLDINSINQSYKRFTIPSIIKSAIELSETLKDGVEFLKKSKILLLRLEDSDIEFSYGYGIEDPHIWNLRIIDAPEGIAAFTTDFDYFSDKINCFWELGYFYATFRWIRKMSPYAASIAEKNLVALAERHSLESKFMFWLGALSSYCGYKDSLRSFIKGEGLHELEKEYKTIEVLDETVASLTKNILT